MRIRRCAALALCLMMTMAAAVAEGTGVFFRLRAEVAPEQYGEESADLYAGLQQILAVAEAEGSFLTDGPFFLLDATLHLGEGRDECSAALSIFGTDSHWGVTSSLLGDTELMVNCAALLPFGQKARSYLDIPLDQTALLVPYTHVEAFRSVTTLFAPLFPKEDAEFTLSQAEVDALVDEMMRLAHEDAALYNYLETTGLYASFLRFGESYRNTRELLLPSLTVRRAGNTLTWRAGSRTLLTLRTENGQTTLDFALPTVAEVHAAITRDDQAITGSLRMLVGLFQAEGSLTLPASAKVSGDIALALDMTAPDMLEGGYHLRFSGTLAEGALFLQRLNPDTNAPMLTITGQLTPATGNVPAAAPESLTGFNVLSVNGDSLKALLAEVQTPLLNGFFDLVIAAPAEGVQLLMDYAEDSGLLDLLADALIGGTGY